MRLERFGEWTMMVSGIHSEARSRVAAALLATAERSAAGRLADTSPTSSKTRRTIRMVGSISWSPSLFPTPNRGAIPKFHARGTVRRMSAIMVSGVHGEARRLRVTAAFLAAAERSAAGRLADASPPSWPPFCDEAWDSG
jgi:hypothetical protein